jgi:uncharacterized NAD(P)/FAD-binding protein YdhS
MKVIAIIGFGFCGRLAFFHLVQKVDKNTKVLIFSKDKKNDLGPAFSSFSPHYILNVPANKMSAFVDKPKDFCQFLEKKYPQIFHKIGEDGYAPRQIYGEYLQQITDEAFANAKRSGVEFKFVDEEVIDVTNGGEQFLVTTKNNNSFKANEIIVATSFKQNDLPFKFDSRNIVKKLWTPQKRFALFEDQKTFHQKKLTNETICLIGSGLTAVDVIVGLKNKNFKGKIFVISRRGNFPKKHFSTKDSPSLGAKASEDILRLTSELQLMRSSALQAKNDESFASKNDSMLGANPVLAICLKIRKFLRANPQLDLRHVIDSLRPITTQLWQNFDEKNKKLFLRLSPYWNIFRHRAPISSVEMIEKMIESGQIEIKKKGVKNIAQTQDGKRILVQVFGEKLECDYLVNCLGFEFRAEKYPLLSQMIKNNLFKADIMLASCNHPKIHLLGGLNIGRDFECTAVPDLRVNVEKSVAAIL